MSNEKNPANLMWVLTMIFWWVPPLIFYLTKKEDAFLYSQAKLALNLSLNFFIVALVFNIILGIIIGIVPALYFLAYLGYAIWFAWIFVCFKQMKKAEETTGEAQLALPIPMITLIK